MAVVTIRGHLGSGATEIGELVAAKLHADYVDREIIADVAEVLNKRQADVAAKEMPPGSLMGRIAEALGRSYTIGGAGTYPPVYAPTWEMPLDDSQYMAGLTSVINALASGKKSIVLRGRGSQFILADHPDALHTLIVAPLRTRIKRVMADMKLDAEAAKKEIERIDGSNKEFIKRYFRADLDNPANYDLVVNTEHLSNEAAAALIASALPLRSGAAK